MKPITIEALSSVQRRALCLYTQDQVENKIDQMAQAIRQRIEMNNPVVCCVMTGGLIFCAELLCRWDFPLQLDYLHATRYGNKTQGGELEWQAAPKATLKGRTVLIVDDILDEGKTLAELVKACHRQQAETVLTAVLVNKIHDRKVTQGQKTMTADFIGLEVEDKYVFGYGMDYQGYFRNLKGIYALSD